MSFVPDDGNDGLKRLYCVKSIQTQTVFVTRHPLSGRHEPNE
jgi:hypothetical protein